MPSLTCPHCGSSLTAPDHSTAPLRCPVCGALLTSATGGAPSGAPRSHPLVVQEAVVRDLREEDDSATRPVAPELLAPILAEAVTAHTAPSIPSATPADETTRALPNTPPPDTTHEMPLSAIPREPSTPPKSADTLRTLSLTLAALTLLAVVVVAALAANGVITIGGPSGAQATATTAPTQVVPTGTPLLKPFGVTGLYQIAYPEGWTVQQRNAAPQSYYALLSAPQGKANVNIEAQQAANVPTLSDLNAQFLRALAQPGTTPTIDPSPASVTVGGQEWTPTTADVTLVGASGQPTRYSHVVILSAIHGDYAYTIVLLAPTDSADTTSAAYVNADSAYFQPLLASLAFQS